MRNLIAKAAQRLLKTSPTHGMAELALSRDEAFARRSANPGPIEARFFAHKGRLVHKWMHYLPVYDRALAPYRGRPVIMLEIGVAQGGSLDMWRDYFGPEATLYGIDINPACAERATPPNQVRIGSQADPAFLRTVVAEMGAPDIILDDGSHIAAHQRVSFQTLWPLLKVGGLYIIEDLHTAYWSWMGGGYRRRWTAIELVKDLIDDAHGWYHGRGQKLVPAEEIGAIRLYDSIVVIEKVNRPTPGHYKPAGEGFPPS